MLSCKLVCCFGEVGLKRNNTASFVVAWSTACIHTNISHPCTLSRKCITLMHRAILNHRAECVMCNRSRPRSINKCLETPNAQKLRPRLLEPGKELEKAHHASSHQLHNKHLITKFIHTNLNGHVTTHTQTKNLKIPLVQADIILLPTNL